MVIELTVNRDGWVCELQIVNGAIPLPQDEYNQTAEGWCQCETDWGVLSIPFSQSLFFKQTGRVFPLNLDSLGSDHEFYLLALAQLESWARMQVKDYCAPPITSVFWQQVSHAQLPPDTELMVGELPGTRIRFRKLNAFVRYCEWHRQFFPDSIRTDLPEIRCTALIRLPEHLGTPVAGSVIPLRTQQDRLSHTGCIECRLDIEKNGLIVSQSVFELDSSDDLYTFEPVSEPGYFKPTYSNWIELGSTAIQLQQFPILGHAIQQCIESDWPQIRMRVNGSTFDGEVIRFGHHLAVQCHQQELSE
ncbi:MAG TPA: hypothetical protein VGE55_13150 [Limnobacter sp.]|uniref:hypothetical protein n=1 Tax=Limnobacter sp. TaxID=2003368 RepID=UPI002ED85ECE